MGYRISPSEKNSLAFAFAVASNNYQGKETPSEEDYNAEDDAELHEQKRSDKNKLFGKMRYRQKPTW